LILGKTYMDLVYNYPRCKVVRVVDGDTIDVVIDLGCNVFTRQRLRLRGINTPEVRGPERPQGLEAADALRTLLETYEMSCGIETYKDRTGKYGRLLAEVWVAGAVKDIHVNQWLVTNGHAEAI